jgi:nitrite reductase/ring-hydroxylating ferredoxin subunit
MCICAYVYLCICVYVYMCICVYVYMCICVTMVRTVYAAYIQCTYMQCLSYREAFVYPHHIPCKIHTHCVSYREGKCTATKRKSSRSSHPHVSRVARTPYLRTPLPVRHARMYLDAPYIYTGAPRYIITHTSPCETRQNVHGRPIYIQGRPSTLLHTPLPTPLPVRHICRIRHVCIVPGHAHTQHGTSEGDTVERLWVITVERLWVITVEELWDIL